MAVQIAVGIVLGFLAIVMLIHTAHEGKDEPAVFGGLLVFYGAVLFGIMWVLRYVGVI